MEWILQTGYWSDSGFWSDSERWRDSIYASLEKPNIELFRPELEYDQRMFNVINRVNVEQQINLWSLKDTVVYSNYFAGYVWDFELMDLARFFTRDYWVENFTSIIFAVNSACSYESFLSLIGSALGAGTIVSFQTPKAGHLIIYIQSGTDQDAFGAFNGVSTDLVVTEGGDQIVFSNAKSPLTVAETEALVRLLVPSGVFVEIVFGLIPE